MSGNFTFRELADWSGGEWRGAPAPGSFSGISNDTRTIGAGAFYIALRGDRFDGHDFLGKAFANGASAAVVERKWLASGGMGCVAPGWALLVVDNSRAALRDMARGYRGRSNAEITGVTGSAGKTTVKEMIAGILSERFATVCTRGNWNNDIGLPLSIMAMDENTQMGVFEVGTNHPGEIAGLCSILQPVCGVVTNVGSAHIEFFGSVEAIAREKSALMKCLPEKGTAVLCVDDEFYGMMVSAAGCAVTTVSFGGDADYRCLEQSAGGEVEIEEKCTGERVKYRAVLSGKHNVVNALMAIAVGRRYGVGWDGIIAALEGFTTLPMRWERSCVGGVNIINDAYNANPVSMRAALSAFGAEEASGGKWVVLADMKELGADSEKEHFRLGEFVGSGGWAGVVLVGECGAVVARGVESAGFDKGFIYRCGGNDEAVKILKKHARSGDVVLFKASRGMHLEEVVEGLIG